VAKSKSRENLKAELDARKIGYDDKLTDSEMAELLKKADDAEKAVEKKSEINREVDLSGVRCGLSTIQDHEIRIVKIERQLESLKNA